MEYLGLAATVFGIGLLVFIWLMKANRSIANQLFDEHAHGFFARYARFYHALAGIVWFTTTVLGGLAYGVFAVLPGHDSKTYLTLVIVGVMFTHVVPICIMRGVNLAHRSKR